MLLSKHSTPTGNRWAIDGKYLPSDWQLSTWLAKEASTARSELEPFATTETAEGRLAAPIEPTQEVWASGVTYMSSRLAREAESQAKDVYEKVYDAPRPELFFKALGWRVSGSEEPIRVRRDSSWNVPEPELTLLFNSRGEILGYTAGNDVSSRSIEGENPLYLPQAKVYDGACSLGPYIRIADPEAIKDIPIEVQIERGSETVFQGKTRTSQMKRTFAELGRYLFSELSFPKGVFLMTGTGIIPSESFDLSPGDIVRITIEDICLENPVA